MPDSPNKLSQFWQELKRRKVVRVITVYAAAAFVILELVSIIVEPLKLPEWFLPVVIVLLCIGFIIAIILSWIYDIKPEGGIVKTEPAHRVKAEDQPASSNSWKIASYISFLVIVAFVVFYLVGNNKKSFDISKLEKSIAVLPLKYLSEDPNKQYLADGVLDAITQHLSMIEGLRVMPRTSVEQYRENKKSAKEIGEELDVSFLIEGSFFMIEDQVKLTIKLVVAEEGDHVFSEDYDRNYEDIFAVQSEVAKTIAKEIEVAITPEEKQRIEKVPTTSLKALDFYQRGTEEHNHYWLDNNNKEALERAEDFYYKALDYDSTFALAYIGLTNVYQDKHFWETYLSEDFLDSVLILADIALSYDNQLADAYNKKGYYYSQKGKNDQAIAEFEKAIKFNPNDWSAYNMSANLYNMSDDKIKTLGNRYKAASLNHGLELPSILRKIGEAYYCAGFNEKSKYYYQEALKLHSDSVSYYYDLMLSERVLGNFEKAIEFGEKGYVQDSLRTELLYILGEIHMYLGQYEESLKYYNKLVNRFKSQGIPIRYSGVIGYVYWVNGYKDEAEYYFNEQINYSSRIIELDREFVNKFWEYYHLASVYAFTGQKNKAYENLNIFNQRQKMCLYEVIVINNDPLFDSIRDEPEFQQIVRDVEAKHQAEHERVRKWLEENDML